MSKLQTAVPSHFAQELNTYYSAMSARFAIVKLRLIRWDYSRVNVTPMSSSSTDTFLSEADRNTYLAEDDWRRKELNFNVSFDYFIYDVGGGTRLFQDYKRIRRAKYRF